MPDNELSTILMQEIRPLRDEMRHLTESVASLKESMIHVLRSTEITAQYGERIRALEQDVKNLQADQRSAATERRWVIGLVVAVALAVIGLMVQRGHP